jgi:hypothetical protein
MQERDCVLSCEKNLKLSHPTLPLEPTESIANQRPEMPHCG